MDERRMTTGGEPSRIPDNICRIVMLGMPGVGKTENIYPYNAIIDEENVYLEIFDTAGTCDGISLDSMYGLWGNCFMYVYGIDDRSSFQAISKIKQQMDALKHPRDTLSFIIANKGDLQFHRQVLPEEGRALAAGLSCQFCEISASDGDQVDSVMNMFHDVYKAYKQHKLNPEGQRQGKAKKHNMSPANFKRAIQKVIIGKRFTSIQKH